MMRILNENKPLKSWKLYGILTSPPASFSSSSSSSSTSAAAAVDTDAKTVDADADADDALPEGVPGNPTYSIANRVLKPGDGNTANSAALFRQPTEEDPSLSSESSQQKMGPLKTVQQYLKSDRKVLLDERNAPEDAMTEANADYVFKIESSKVEGRYFSHFLLETT